MIIGFCILGWRVLLFGSKSNNSVKAGAFYVNSNNSSSNTSSNIGTHLCLLLKRKTKCKILASWQNTKQSLVQFSTVSEKLEVK